MNLHCKLVLVPYRGHEHGLLYYPVKTPKFTERQQALFLNWYLSSGSALEKAILQNNEIST